MPTKHIISRIRNIEERIHEIQSISKAHQKNTSKITNNKKDTFSDILKEVTIAKAKSQLNSLDNGLGIVDSNSKNIQNLLLENRLDSLAKEYIKGQEPQKAQATPILSNIIDTNNPGTWDHIITTAANKYDLDSRLIHAVIQVESSYNPNAISHVGAEGLMQIMPYTAEELGVDNSFDPKQNIMGGANYLRQMLNTFDGDLIKSLAAYNAGPDAVQKANGIPPYKETQEYVPKILNYYYNMRQIN